MLSNCRSIGKSKEKKDQRERRRRRRKRNARENLLVVVRGLGLREKRRCFNGVADAVEEEKVRSVLPVVVVIGYVLIGGFFFSNPFLIFIKKIFI